MRRHRAAAARARASAGAAASCGRRRGESTPGSQRRPAARPTGTAGSFAMAIATSRSASARLAVARRRCLSADAACGTRSGPGAAPSRGRARLRRPRLQPVVPASHLVAALWVTRNRPRTVHANADTPPHDAHAAHSADAALPRAAAAAAPGSRLAALLGRRSRRCSTPTATGWSASPGCASRCSRCCS